MCTVCAVPEATPQDEGPGAQTGGRRVSSYPSLFSLSLKTRTACTTCTPVVPQRLLCSRLCTMCAVWRWTIRRADVRPRPEQPLHLFSRHHAPTVLCKL